MMYVLENPWGLLITMKTTGVHNLREIVAAVSLTVP